MTSDCLFFVFASVVVAAVDLWKSHMAETFWLYSLLDAMVVTAAPNGAEGLHRGEGASRPADAVPVPLSSGGTGRLPRRSQQTDAARVPCPASFRYLACLYRKQIRVEMPVGAF